MAWIGSGLEGGGFCNTIEMSPFETGVGVIGGDVYGIYRTDDGGLTWEPANAAFTTTSQLKVAAFAWQSASTVWALVGNGTTGGIYRSTDRGVTWVRQSATPVGNGGDPDSIPGWPSPTQEHPRSTGHLIAIGSTYIYAGTFEDGLYRAALSAPTVWTRLTGFASPDNYIRSIYLDPADNTTLFVSVYDATGAAGKVWRSTNANTATAGSVTFTELTGSKTVTEDMVMVGTTLIAAVQKGTPGIWKLPNAKTAAAGAAWTKETGVPTSGHMWRSVVADSNGVLYVGAANPQLSGSGTYPSVYRGTSANWATTLGTWAQMPDLYGTRIHNSIANTGREWWTINARSSYALGKDVHDNANISIDAGNVNTVYICGRSGVWRTDEANLGGAADWYPYIRYIGATINRPGFVDPQNPDMYVTGNVDYTYLVSEDAGLSFTAPTNTEKDGNMGSAGYGVTLDPDVVTNGHAKMFVSSSPRGGTSGGVLHSVLDPADFASMPGSWVDEGLGTQTALPTGGAVATGLIKVVDGSNVPYLIAAVYNVGVVRKNLNTGTWSAPTSSPAATIMKTQATLAASFAWKRGSSKVYLYDRNSGVWRGDNYGASWVRIISSASDIESTGYVEVDPVTEGTLYISNNAGVYKVTGAHTATQDSVVLNAGKSIDAAVSVFDSPGALALDAGKSQLHVLNRGNAKVYRMELSNPGVWTDYTDGVFPDQGLFAFDMSVASTGQVYVSLNGTGVVTYTPPAEVGESGDMSTAQITVVTPGTSIQGADYTCQKAVIQADPSNTGDIYFGSSDVEQGRQGFKLKPGEVVPLNVTNTNQLWFDSTAASQKVRLWILK